MDVSRRRPFTGRPWTGLHGAGGGFARRSTAKLDGGLLNRTGGFLVARHFQEPDAAARREPARAVGDSQPANDAGLASQASQANPIQIPFSPSCGVQERPFVLWGTEWGTGGGGEL